MSDTGYGIELFDLLTAMELPVGSYAVFGSGPLLLRGIIDTVNDLDVICLEPAWDAVRQVGGLVNLSPDVQIVSTHDGAITFGRRWGYGSFDIPGLITSAEYLAGIPCVLLEHIVAYKEVAARPKDLDHLALIARYLAKTGAESS